jgi:catechol 2,3-dioxygenase-like lactoylglutathione lyase family enzyme
MGAFIDPSRMGRAMRKSSRAPEATDPTPVFASVAVMVSDRDRAVEWYTRVLGLEVVESNDHWVTVGRRGVNGTIHLCQFSDLPDLGPEPGETGIDLQLPGNFEEMCRVLEQRGVAFIRPATRRPWGWYAKVVDPDGNELRLTPGRATLPSARSKRLRPSPSAARPRLRRAER